MGCREGRWKMGPQGLEAQTTVLVRLVRCRNASRMKQACGRTQRDPAAVRRAGLGISLGPQGPKLSLRYAGGKQELSPCR